MSDEVHRRIEAVWRIESAKVVAGVMRLTRDLGLAEDCAQDALIAALEHWPGEGLPDNPGAWLMTTAKHRALDRLRAATLHARKHEDLGADLDALQASVTPDIADQIDERRADDIGDDLLRLIFIACHPVLPPAARVALTLRLLGGLSTAEIARAFLTTEPTIAQRIVRAKRKLAAAQVPFEVPGPEARAERLASVHEVLYLVFNEGYSATSGDQWQRPALMDEALRLGRVLLTLAPQDAASHGLFALMALQASRGPARHDEQGRPLRLAEQDRRRWDPLLIRHGLDALARAQALARSQGAADEAYTLQAGIAACHARAARSEDTDWAAIVTLYDQLWAMSSSPVVALNRAVAVGMAQGPAAPLALVETLLDEPALAGYPWLHGAHGDLLERVGRVDEARAAFVRAAELAHNPDDRALMAERAGRAGRTERARG